MARRGDALTLTQDVYARLRQAILRGELAPGQPVRPAEVSKQLDVSVSVVREALTRLAEKGLVESEQNRGFFVTRLSEEGLAQLVLVRQLNEGRALELSITLGDLTWEGDLLAAHHRMVNTPVYAQEDAEHSNEAFAAAHRDFHFALFNACGNATLLDICHRLYDAGELYRRWSAPLISKRPKGGNEHKAIMDAALQRDVPEALRLYSEHVARTANLALQVSERS
jgi:DNA-binding GntR family transcriptional regulator